MTHDGLFSFLLSKHLPQRNQSYVDLFLQVNCLTIRHLTSGSSSRNLRNLKSEASSTVPEPIDSVRLKVHSPKPALPRYISKEIAGHFILKKLLHRLPYQIGYGKTLI